MADKRVEDVFFALLRAGLWEQDVCISSYEPIDFAALYALAEEQSVVGLIAAGLEHVTDRIIIKKEALPFLKKVISTESRNEAMNEFIEDLIGRLDLGGITSVLVKGQGIAQCYERPMWRSSGDIDLLLNDKGYKNAKSILSPIAFFVEKEDATRLHLCLRFDRWSVELHGSLRNPLLRRANNVIDEAQADTFQNSNYRKWKNGRTDVLLPGPDNDVIFVFTHILQHFFGTGIGLRQICDWCRLLVSSRNSINNSLLEGRLRRMGLITEWKAFSAYAVDYLGMPADALPLYNANTVWSRKAYRINHYILSVGNMGHNRDSSVYEKYPYLISKTISFWRILGTFCGTMIAFPVDATIAFFRRLLNGFSALSNGD